MGRNLSPQCRLCRRLGVKLFLKGSRCFSPLCPLEKKGAVPPGVHGNSFRRLSAYGKQLAEKQKIKALYGLSEHHLKRYFDEARRHRKETDTALWQILESRLDNVLFRLGFAPNRRTARQLVNHKKVFVDGKRVTIPSYRVKPGQLVSLDKKALEIPQVNKTIEENPPLPSWLKKKALVGKVVKLPSKEDIKEDIDVALIIEFYSR